MTAEQFKNELFGLNEEFKQLNDEAKDVFFRSLMEVYLESKEEAKTKFSSKKRVGKNRK